MPPALRTHPPSGVIAWPLVLVEGEEKSGRSRLCYQISTSPRVGRTFVIDLGEGTAEEYASLGPYEVVEHDGTWGSIYNAIEAICALPHEPDRPHVIVVDDGTALWEVLRLWIDHRAVANKENQRKLEADPNAKIDVPQHLWNDAKERWGKVVNMLRKSEVIGVIIARGKEVTKYADGQMIAGETEYKVEAEKTITAACTLWVRMTRSPRSARIVGARSNLFDIGDDGLALPLNHQTLHHAIFEVLGSGRTFGPSSAILPQVGITVLEAKSRLLARFHRAGWRGDDAKVVAGATWRAVFEDGLHEVTELDYATKLPDAVIYGPRDPNPVRRFTLGCGCVADIDTRFAAVGDDVECPTEHGQQAIEKPLDTTEPPPDPPAAAPDPSPEPPADDLPDTPDDPTEPSPGDSGPDPEPTEAPAPDPTPDDPPAEGGTLDRDALRREIARLEGGGNGSDLADVEADPPRQITGDEMQAIIDALDDDARSMYVGDAARNGWPFPGDHDHWTEETIAAVAEALHRILGPAEAAVVLA